MPSKKTKEEAFIGSIELIAWLDEQNEHTLITHEGEAYLRGCVANGGTLKFMSIESYEDLEARYEDCRDELRALKAKKKWFR